MRWPRARREQSRLISREIRDRTLPPLITRGPALEPLLAVGTSGFFPVLFLSSAEMLSSLLSQPRPVGLPEAVLRVRGSCLPLLLSVEGEGHEGSSSSRSWGLQPSELGRWRYSRVFGWQMSISTALRKRCPKSGLAEYLFAVPPRPVPQGYAPFPSRAAAACPGAGCFLGEPSLVGLGLRPPRRCGQSSVGVPLILGKRGRGAPRAACRQREPCILRFYAQPDTPINELI